MGYKVKKKEITVRFGEDHDLYGLEATFEGMSIGTYLDALNSKESEEESGKLIIEKCAKALKSWNLETENGKPIPATEANFLKQDTDLVLALSTAWWSTVAGVAPNDPLENNSNSTGTLPEGSIPMETL